MMIPFTPPAANAAASCSARSITALRLPPQPQDVGRAKEMDHPQNWVRRFENLLQIHGFRSWMQQGWLNALTIQETALT